MSSYVIPVDGAVLACVDHSLYADSVASHALWAAQRLSAPLRFLHVLDREVAAAGDDLSGSIGVDAQLQLLKQLSELDEQRSRLAAERGRLLLQRVREQARVGGLAETETQSRHGGLVDALTENEADVRLFVLGKRGESADFAKGHLGANLERVIRAVSRPLLVAARAFRPIERFLIAFDGGATTRKCVDMVTMSPLLQGLPCHLLSVGADDDGLREAQAWARQRLQAAGHEVQTVLRPGDPERVIAEHVRDNAIDLLVMGAYGHSRIRHLIVGSTTTSVIRSCLIPVLLLR